MQDRADNNNHNSIISPLEMQLERRFGRILKDAVWQTLYHNNLTGIYTSFKTFINICHLYEFLPVYIQVSVQFPSGGKYTIGNMFYYTLDIKATRL